MPQFKAAFESSPTGMIIINSDGKITAVNKEIERLFGYDRIELVGQLVEILIPDAHKTGHPVYRDGYIKSPESRMMGTGRRKDGTEVPVEIGLTPVKTASDTFVVGSVADISYRKRAENEQRRLEEQLRQAQKMEALGQLAGGIAHDFNSILQAIMTHAETAMGHATQPGIPDYLKNICVNAERGRYLVERIMAFSRRQDLDLQPINLKNQVEGTLSFLKAILPPGLDLKFNVEPGLPEIMADMTSIDLILMNLANNAAQSMHSDGELDIALESFYAKDNFVRSHPELSEGWYIRLLVRDTGNGMSEEVRKRAFDPFYTTKVAKRGSGLGLTIVQSLVHEHKGCIWIDSEEGAGTAVSCLFPTLAESEGVYVGDEVSLPYGHHQKIMCVDDEPALQSVNNQILSDLGYKPSVFVDPRVALEVFRVSPKEFDLAIIDYSMPYMDGLRLASELRRIQPEIPLILVSGSIQEEVKKQSETAGADVLLRKPFTRLELAHTLFSILTPH